MFLCLADGRSVLDRSTFSVRFALYFVTFFTANCGGFYLDLGLLLPTILLLACKTEARISVMYAHEKQSDIIAGMCLNEMYPKLKRIEIQESDEPCIIFCVLKKFGIMGSNGAINLEVYKKRVAQVAHQISQHNGLSDSGGRCLESAESILHKQDVCKKAKVFNDCTHLYRILL